MTSSEESPKAAPAKDHQEPETTAENPDAPTNTAEESPDNTAKEAKESGPKNETSEQTETEPPKPKDGVFLGPHGNALGDKIESGLSPVGKPLGKGLGVIGKPIGGLVEPLVGGLLKSGGAYGEAAGVGAGNLDHEKAEEEEKKRAPIGGKEQTGDNPLGLA